IALFSISRSDQKGARLSSSAMDNNLVPLSSFWAEVKLISDLLTMILACPNTFRQGCISGDCPEVGERSFAALRVTAGGFVILSAAKDLCVVEPDPSRRSEPAFQRSGGMT